MKVKVWEKDSEEPSLWTGTAEFSGIKEGGLSLYYMDFQESAAQFDNLKVLKYEEKGQLRNIKMTKLHHH